MKTLLTVGTEVCGPNRQETNFKRLQRKTAPACTRIKSLAFFALAVLLAEAGSIPHFINTTTLAQAVRRTAVQDIDGRVASIVSDWESLPSIFDDIDTYTAQIKELVEIGKPA